MCLACFPAEKLCQNSEKLSFPRTDCVVIRYYVISTPFGYAQDKLREKSCLFKIPHMRSE